MTISPRFEPSATGWWLGRPGERNRRSSISSSKCVFAGIRIAYWTPRASSASSIAGRATAASAWNDALALGLLAVDLGHEQVLQSSALETLPGCSFAATQLPGSLNKNGGWSQTDSKCPLEAPPSCSHAPGSRSNPCRARCGRLGRTSPPVRSGRGSPPSTHRGCRHGSAARSLPGPGGQPRCPALPRDHGQRRVHGADPGNGCSILVNLASRRQRVGRLFVVRTDDGLIVKRVGRDDAGAWQLVSENADKHVWPHRPWPADVVIVGEVKRSSGSHGRSSEEASHRTTDHRRASRCTPQRRAWRPRSPGPSHSADHVAGCAPADNPIPDTAVTEIACVADDQPEGEAEGERNRRQGMSGGHGADHESAHHPGEENREETCRDSL